MQNRLVKIAIAAVLVAVPPASLAADGTDAFIKLRDERKRHPRVSAISFPGNTVWRQAYDAIYGHGAMTENPWAGFRIYMNASQAIDLYLKATPGLELDETCFYTDAKAVAAGKGCDVLRVGKSVGAGSFRGYRDGAVCDIEPVAERTMRVPDDSTVVVEVRGWRYGDHAIDMVQTYRVSASSPALEVTVRLSGYAPDDVFCTGVQKLDSACTGFTEKNIAASWGINAPDGKHPEQVETVGLGVCVDSRNLAGAQETATDYLLKVRPDSEGVIRYRVLADGLRAATGAKTADEWFDKVRGFFLPKKR